MNLCSGNTSAKPSACGGKNKGHTKGVRGARMACVHTGQRRPMNAVQQAGPARPLNQPSMPCWRDNSSAPTAFKHWLLSARNPGLQNAHLLNQVLHRSVAHTHGARRTITHPYYVRAHDTKSAKQAHLLNEVLHGSVALHQPKALLGLQDRTRGWAAKGGRPSACSAQWPTNCGPPDDQANPALC